MDEPTTGSVKLPSGETLEYFRWELGEIRSDTYGGRLRELRKQHGKTQGEVARALNVKVSFVSDVELDEVAPYTAAQEQQIADLLGVSVEVVRGT